MPPRVEVLRSAALAPVAGCGTNFPMKHWHVLVLSLATLLASCSKGSESDSESEALAAEAAETPTREAAGVASAFDTAGPCDLLTEALVRKHLGLGDDIELNQRFSNLAGHPHCSYNWSTLTPEEEKERNAALAKKAIDMAKKQDTTQSMVDRAMSQASGQGSAHLTTTKVLDSEEAAIGALQSARTFMEKREKARGGYDSATYTSPFVDVAGVGAKAHYFKKQRQLSFAYGKRLYHLGVSPQDDRDAQELARTIANEIFK